MRLFFQIVLAMVCGGFALLTGIADASQICKGVWREESLTLRRAQCCYCRRGLQSLYGHV